jgi:hypothetical protein
VTPDDEDFDDDDEGLAGDPRAWRAAAAIASAQLLVRLIDYFRKLEK